MFNEINWKEKLTSRKFWMAIIGFVTAILTMFNIPEPTIQQAVMLLGAISTLIAYIIGQGLVDAAIESARVHVIEVPVKKEEDYLG